MNWEYILIEINLHHWIYMNQFVPLDQHNKPHCLSFDNTEEKKLWWKWQIFVFHSSYQD